MNPAELACRHFADPCTSWAIGTFGAIAEFHRDADEPVDLFANGAVTARGGIRLQFDSGIRTVAWERPTAGDGWTHGIALCLPLAAGAMNRRTTVTELGPDSDAFQEEAREEVLFDLGIGAPHCDVCVRTTDPAVLRLLQAAAGRPLSETGLLNELARVSPTRVFVSRLGRIEVRAPIPPPDGRTPDGPHTHVLSDLLKHRRTHSANVPLPAGMVPSAELFPASAIHDAHGRKSAFDAGKHEAFQQLLAIFGDPACTAVKTATADAIRAGKPPADNLRYSRAQRQARRVALRQLAQTDGPSAALKRWREAFDRDDSKES
jgi:hypothetical protein